MRTPFLPFLIAASLAVSTLPAEGSQLSPETHMRIMELTTAGPPAVDGGSLIFTARMPAARFVGIAFQSEDWATVHPMLKNPKGIFFAVWPVPPMMRDPVRYRLLVDGAWCSDPVNPERDIDPDTGLSVSCVQPPLVSDEKAGVYKLLDEDGRTVHFRFRGQEGQLVTVAGTFNGWDPFMYEMDETEPGLYTLDLALPAGVHRYAFYCAGEEYYDRLNPDSSWTQTGTRVSRIVIGGAGAGSPGGRAVVRK